jgi:hypothetical protein
MIQADIPPPPPGQLFAYQLPSGMQVVGTLSNFKEDQGTLRFSVDITPEHLQCTYLQSLDDVVCQLPSGLGVVEKYAFVESDRATVVGKIFDSIPQRS